MNLGRRFADRYPAGRQNTLTQPRLLAHGQNPGPTARLVQRVVETPWFGQYQRPLDQGSGLCYLSYHRLRRARQLVEPPTADPHGGWRGGRELETPGYSISRHRAHRCTGGLVAEGRPSTR